MLYNSQSGNHPQEHVAKFGYKLNISRNLKKTLSIFLATFLKLVQKSGEFS
jgi:hypothetical protein